MNYVKDVYVIKLLDGGKCQIRVCQKDEKGVEMPDSVSDICLLYNEPWGATVEEYINRFFTKHPEVSTFSEQRNAERKISVYNIVTVDGSELSVDVFREVKKNSHIIAARKSINK